MLSPRTDQPPRPVVSGRETALFIDNWLRYGAGELLRNVVFKREGY